jgi:hypothetical protein
MSENTKKIAYYILTLLLLISNGGMLYDSYPTGDDEGDKEDKGDNKNEILILVFIQIIFSLIIILILPLITSISIENSIMINLGISAIILFIHEILFSIKENINYNIFSPWYSNYQFRSEAPSQFVFDSMKLFKISYLILMILSFTYAENKVASVGIVIVFGLFFQLLNNAILYSLSNKEVIPSVFMYLDEYMKNSNMDDKTKLGTFFEIMGILRLAVIFTISIIIAYHFKVKGRLIEFLGAFTLIFTILIALWQLFIGDECILNRTLNQYKGSYTDNIDKYTQMTLGSLQEIAQAQGGAFFNIALLLLAIFIGDKGN